MTFTLSPPVRYAALVGLLAAVLIGGGMTVLGQREGAVATPKAIKHHPFGPGAKKAAAAPSKKQSARATPPKAAKPQATPTVPAAPKAAAQPSAVVAALAAGLPGAIATALGRRQTVVVAIYNPYSQVDGIAFAEARAGAKIAGVGFVGLNVLSQNQVGKLTQTLGLLPDPGLLVYKRPGTLVARISGFADKETVAQAAHNASLGT